jgi:hypothetical protein
MATSTPNLSLSLMGIGESVGTWGVPLNNNFTKIDLLAGEIFSARGSETDLNGRFGTIESEIATARGILPTLNDRLSVMLQTDGNIVIENFPKSGMSAFGVTKLSLNAVDPEEPIAVGDNDPRILSQVDHDALTGAGLTHLHKHTLDDDIIDVTATAAEINQVITGAPVTVTAVNLGELTDGSETSLHSHVEAGYGTKGFAQLSATPIDSQQPIAVGDNDTRVLDQVDKDALITGNITALHRHNLVDGAADVTVDAVTLNRLTGAGTNVTASNLDALTGGSSTSLHDHDNQYYTKVESDSQSTAGQVYADAAVAVHNGLATAHQGQDLQLGDISVVSILADTVGIKHTIRSHPSDAANAIKSEVKDSSGVSKFSIDASGSVVCHDLVVNGTQTVVETTTLSQAAVATDNLTVNGDTTLGDNNLSDLLTVNCLTSTFNGTIDVLGGINVTGTVDGVDIASLSVNFGLTSGEVISARGAEASLEGRFITDEADITALQNEVVAARGPQVDLDTRLDGIETIHNDFVVLANNPHTVTLTQAIAADGGTNITPAELETLSTGADADALHVHGATDFAISGALTSAVYGTFGSISLRHDALDAVVNGHETEIVNARGVEASVDARLDAMALIDSNQDTRMNGIDADVLLRTKKYTEVLTPASDTWVLIHSLNTKDVVVKVYDNLDEEIFQAAITSVVTTDANTVTVILDSSQTGRAVIIG